MIISSHSEKYKTVSECAKVCAEGEHSLDDEKAYRSDVDLSQRYRNFVSLEFKNASHCVAKMRASEEICERSTGRKIRRDAVHMFSTVTSFPKSWPDDAVKELAKELYDVHTELLKEAGMAAGFRCGYVVHFDEKSPHMHEYDIPMTNAKKLSCKTILSKATLSAFHKAEYETYRAFAERHPELEKMESYTHGSARRHLGTQAFKKEKLEKEIGDLSKQKSDLQKEADVLERKRQDMDSAVSTRQEKIKDLESKKSDLENDVAMASAELPLVRNQLRQLDEDVDERKKKKAELDRELAESENKRAELELSMKAINTQVEPLRALEREISASKASYDEITRSADEDAEAVRSAFAESEEVSFGKHRGLLKVFVPKGTYERLRRLVEKAETFTKAYDAVSGLASKVEAVLDKAKDFYRQAQSDLKRAESIVSGEAYRDALGQLQKAVDDRNKAVKEEREASDHFNALWENMESLSDRCNSLERQRDSLADEVDGLKGRKYEHQFAQKYRDDFDDFVADQKRRERAREDDFFER